MKKITIAIDGYSGCGKSSTAKAVARHLNYAYIDSGAMYRAVTLYLLRNSIDVHDVAAIEAVLDDIRISFQVHQGKNSTFLNDELVEDAIRTMDVSANVSQVSTIGTVRRALVARQQELGREKGVVMDGRDIGTVVFPDAELKIFMTADLKIRAERRRLELKERDVDLPLEEIEANLARRDQIDSTREESPLMKAKDAIELDTSFLTFDEQVARVVEAARKRISEIN